MCKVCKHGLGDIWIVHENGDVRICGWTKFFIGNLIDSSIEELWKGERAQLFRESMLDGSYRYCNSSICPYRANGVLDDYLVDYELPEYPRMVNLAYQRTCNYVCKFCRDDKILPSEKEKENVNRIEEEVRKMIPHLSKLGTNGAGEVFCCDSIMRVLGDFHNLPGEIEIETNGSLANRNQESLLRQIGKGRNLKMMVTVHSFDETTYQFLSGTNLSISTIMDNLKFLSELRDEGVINSLEIASVICERNFREMPQYVRHCLDNYSMDTIRLRFFEAYHVKDRSTEWFYDVRNCYHPYHEEFEKIMKDPIFLHPKVWKWQGDTASLQKYAPDVLEHENVVNLSRCISMRDVDRRFASYINANNIHKPALYGAGDAGIAFSILLGISEIYDTFACECYCNDDFNNFIIQKPEMGLLESNDLIIICQMVHEVEIREELCRNGYKGALITMKEMVACLEKVQI